MRAKIVRLIKKEVYEDKLPKASEEYFRNRETDQIIRDEKRRKYQKTKDRYHQVKVKLNQKESTKALEEARKSIKRRERNKERHEKRKALQDNI